jgi:hypothetical protein
MIPERSLTQLGSGTSHNDDNMSDPTIQEALKLFKQGSARAGNDRI